MCRGWAGMHPEQEKDSFTFLLQCLCSPGLLGQGLSLQCYKWLHFSFIGPKWLFSASPADFLYSTIFFIFPGGPWAWYLYLYCFSTILNNNHTSMIEIPHRLVQQRKGKCWTRTYRLLIHLYVVSDTGTLGSYILWYIIDSSCRSMGILHCLFLHKTTQ